MKIRPFEVADTESVVALWKRCDLVKPWNDPYRDIARKLKVDRELFVVVEIDDEIRAVAMGGYEGHRGWINYLATHPDYRNQGLGKSMVCFLEEQLRARGCPKINIQIRRSNLQAAGFYRQCGFIEDDSISLGKRLIADA